MGVLSQKLSQKNREIFQHTVIAALNTHFNLVQNLRVKLNTHFRCHRKRTAGQSHESGRSKNNSTEFFVTAEEICERLRALRLNLPQSSVKCLFEAQDLALSFAPT